MSDTQQGSSKGLSDRYDPKDVEARIYAWWMSKGYFKAQDRSTKPPFSIIMPPPNVTGQLHLGHGLDHAIQDCLIRWKRMSGFNVLWLPGTDHAGIATQSVVERELKKENKTRQDLGREKFLEKVWQWKELYGNRILEQAKRFGGSADWDRHVFTLDEGVSKAVRRTFVELHKKGWIYKGQRLINWSPALESAISDLEVDHKEIKGTIYHIQYSVHGGGESVTVATTRPETMLGDTAVAVHPDDERYKALIGKKLDLPLTGRQIPIIADPHVDKEFGTGAVKITPAHDFNDYEMGIRHKLEMINILNKDGTLNERAGAYRGLKVQEARKRLLEDLKNQNLLLKEEPHTHQVGHCSRTGVVVEPLLSEQWFVKTKELGIPAKRAVENGTTVFEPEQWTKTYLHWMNVLQDWCISRQLWWGHRIPAYYCQDCKHVTVAESQPKNCEKCQSPKIVQDEDVLDTWFSSALWPFSTMGWPAETDLQKTFYPTDVLVTGHDIIFFWVARMMMMGLEFKRDVPFRTVYIHGLIRDAQGKKMSKSLNNSVDPVELIDGFGADALRFTLLSSVQAGRDIKFSHQKLEGYRNFMNKVWNAARFSLNVLEGWKPAQELPDAKALSDADRWIIFKLGEAEKNIDHALQGMRFSEAALHVYQFIWNEFCDWYLEFIKPIAYGPDSFEKQNSLHVLALVLNRWVRMLHPFSPFISEEIYQKLPIKKDACIIDDYPTPRKDKALIDLGNPEIAFEVDLVCDVITAFRNIRGENKIKPGEKLKAMIYPKDDVGQKILSHNKTAIITLAKLGELDIGPVQSMAKCAVTPVRRGSIDADVIVPLEGLVDINEEVSRVTKLIEKTEKEKSGLAARLADSNFVANAPEDIVTEGKLQVQALESQLILMKANLERLKA